MYNYSLKDIQNSIKDIKQNIRKISIRLSKSPTGKLKCLNRGSYSIYYIDGKYISKKNIDTIGKYAERDYLKKLLPIMQEKLDVLKKLNDLLQYDFDKADHLYESLRPGRKNLITPFLPTKSDYLKDWIETEYNTWEIKDEEVNGNFVTVRNERVRSKSEKIIADELTKYGIPYRYEYPLALNDGNTYAVIRRPDFIAINPRTLKEYIIEHLGLVDNDSYLIKNAEKIYLYEKNGYLIGRDLILFHETANHPLDMTLVDKYIEEYLL